MREYARAAIASDRAARVPLTENQIRDALKVAPLGPALLPMLRDDVLVRDFVAAMVDAARAIERAHKIGSKT